MNRGSMRCEPGTSVVVWNGQEWLVQGTSPATATMTGNITALENQDHISAAEAAKRLVLIYPAASHPMKSCLRQRSAGLP